MPRTPPKPYYSTTPWSGFTPREKKRAADLKRCPSHACRRAKSCQAAHEDLYCQRTHISVPAYRARNRTDEDKEPESRRRPSDDYISFMAELTAYDLETIRLEKTARWKNGEYDDLYGPWSKRGKLMVPPVRQYTE